MHSPYWQRLMRLLKPLIHEALLGIRPNEFIHILDMDARYRTLLKQRLQEAFGEVMEEYQQHELKRRYGTVVVTIDGDHYLAHSLMKPGDGSIGIDAFVERARDLPGKEPDFDQTLDAVRKLKHTLFREHAYIFVGPPGTIPSTLCWDGHGELWYPSNVSDELMRTANPSWRVLRRFTPHKWEV
jgi:hypothetical protein